MVLLRARQMWLRGCLLAVVAACTALGHVAPGFAALPDGRAYELVSPPDKGGGDVMASSDRTRVAVAGRSVAFASLHGFSDVKGTGVSTDYVSERTGRPGTAGWETHAITPHQDPLSVRAVFQGLDPFYEGSFSDDLTTGVFRAFTPLTNAPTVAEVPNLYVRRDVLSSGPGTYELVTDAISPPRPFDTASLRPVFAGASEDFSHVIFQSGQDLTDQALPQPGFCISFGFFCSQHLYEWANGVVRLAGVLPDGTPATSSVAGAGAEAHTFNAISRDGSRVFFTADDGQLYMRIDHTVTVQVSASERTPPDPDPSPAQFQFASDNGTKVFFSTAGQLVNGDEPSGVDLYMYDTTVADDQANLTLVNVDEQPGDGASSQFNGIMAASDDGSHVYFLEDGQLQAGQPDLPFDTGIYHWHAGSVRFIGVLSDVSDGPRLLLQSAWNGGTVAARVTADGSRLLFQTQSGLGLLSQRGGTDYDHGNCGNENTGGCRELYFYNAEHDSLACVSCAAAGTSPVSNAAFNARSGTGGTAATLNPSQPISEDGRWVFFTTGEPLVSEDRNGRASDVYEYDTTDGSVHLVSGGRDASNAYFLTATPDGRSVLFATRARLTGWDVDESYDLYDARIEGGFPEPPASPSGACEGAACRASSPGVPAIQNSGSATVRGRGNVHETVRVKRASRCKKKDHRHGSRQRCRKHHKAEGPKRRVSSPRRQAR